jgi:pimeloyl-ACP methyl ester carboxylesterase
VESQLARIWQSVLGISGIGRHDDFFDLGGTSIQSAEVLARIAELFGASLSPSTLVEHSTIERLAGLVAGYVVIPSPKPLVPLRAADAGRPLFLIHSGQGDVATYGLLTRRLPGRPIYGLQSIGLQGESWPLMSISAMAQRYLAEIVAKDPTGPYLLGATCMGGMVAFELAQMLIRQGRKVGLLALFDVPYPLPKWQHHDRTERLYGPIRDPVRDAFRMLRWFIVRSAGLGRSQHSLTAYRRFVGNMNSRANRSYKPAFFPGAMTLFITAETKYPREDLRLAMRRYAQDSRVIPIPGNRSGLFVQPAVDELARQLQGCLELAGGKESP